MAKELNILEQLYVFEILKGLVITSRHFFRNLIVHTAHAVGLAKDKEAAVTIQYPEVRRPYPEFSRTRHRLTMREDGSLKCVACMMCATACPAECIDIVADEYVDPAIEKYPIKFDIDMGKCVFCGFCVEACPKDAIRMDTGIVELADDSLGKLIYDMKRLSRDVPEHMLSHIKVKL